MSCKKVSMEQTVLALWPNSIQKVFDLEKVRQFPIALDWVCATNFVELHQQYLSLLKYLRQRQVERGQLDRFYDLELAMQQLGCKNNQRFVSEELPDNLL